MSRLGLPIALALLAAFALAIAASTAADVRSRSASPDTLTRRYFTALEAGNVEGALETLPPEARPHWSEFLENIAGNQFRVNGIAVRWPSLLDRAAGASPTPIDVTVFVAVTQLVDDDRWEAAPRVPIVTRDGKSYLAWPPLAPEPD